MANGSRGPPSIRVEDADAPAAAAADAVASSAPDGPKVGRTANDRANRSAAAATKTIKTTTTTTTTTTTETKTATELEQQQRRLQNNQSSSSEQPAADHDGGRLPSIAVVEHLGRRANLNDETASGGGRACLMSSANEWQSSKKKQFDEEEEEEKEDAELVEGNRACSTICVIAAQSGQSRLVLALLKEGDLFQIRIQEMRPAIFEIGSNNSECLKYFEEHQRMLSNVRKQENAPIEAWLSKYQKICQQGEKIKNGGPSGGGRPTVRQMSTERQLVYMCMLENLQACWKASLRQLDKRARLLELACQFYELAERLSRALDKAELHVQTYRQEFLAGPAGAIRFAQACNELRALNQASQLAEDEARAKQQQLVSMIGLIAAGNLAADSRANHLLLDAQNLIAYINGYLEPLCKRRLQLESVLKTTTTTATEITATKTISAASDNSTLPASKSRNQRQFISASDKTGQRQFGAASSNSTMSSCSNKLASGSGGGGGGSYKREINNFNDLSLIEDWLNCKIEQLNSSLLSSLGVSALDSRTILTKHEQIGLECGAIEEAAMLFNGKNIHALKSVDQKDDQFRGQESLFERQRQLSSRARDVAAILSARIVLLRRTIDFYQRSKEATQDISKMMRRLQVDNSLQSVQFVTNELELKDVSSVVASGATIISELQQLQLAQQHGERSQLINLNLVTGGIRSAIDQLNQDLAHLKTVLNQRKLILLNEDVHKMANNFSNKCNQLHFWLNNHVKSFLLSNNNLPVRPNDHDRDHDHDHDHDDRQLLDARSFLDAHEQLRLEVQNKTLEVEALLRSLSTLTENFDAKSQVADSIQRSMDELRQDWISVTSCLERRAEWLRQYLAFLRTIRLTEREMDSLESFINGRPSTPDERTDDDMRASIEQAFVQLAQQLQRLRLEARKSSTELVVAAPAGGGQAADAAATGANTTRQQPTPTAVNELNKGQLLEHAESALVRLGKRRMALGATSASSSSSGNNKNNNNNNSGRNETARLQLGSTASASNSNQDSQLKQQQQQQHEAAHRRPQQLDPPRFTRVLPAELSVAAAGSARGSSTTVELECELDHSSANSCQVEWLMNNFRRIPANIKHSIEREGSQHRLTIHQFSPSCAGTYLIRASNAAGQAVSRCRLQAAAPPATAAPPGGSQATLSSKSAGGGPMETNGKTTTATISRIVQGVESLNRNGMQMSNSNSNSEETNIVTTTETSTTTSGGGGGGHNKRWPPPPPPAHSQKSQPPSNQLSPNWSPQQHQTAGAPRLAVTESSYSGGKPASQQRQHLSTAASQHIDSPDVSSASLSSPQQRSVSRSPLVGTPQPPVFVGQGLCRASSSPRCCSRAGLVCLVVGNPAPTIEWLHNNQTIATTRCPLASSSAAAAAAAAAAESGSGNRSAQRPAANVCKLTIETLNDRTASGEYCCRASNRIGQTTSNKLTLASK